MPSTCKPPKARHKLTSLAYLQQIRGEFQYELVRKIADGGMGVVYEALQKGSGNFNKRVAIKLIREEFSAIEEFRKNFIGEARLVADLIHTNIVQTYHLGDINGQYFMTMEFVRGVNLEQVLDRQRAVGRPMPVEIAVFIVSRIARGLAYAHQKRGPDGRLLGIVHRDVNPKNVMLGFEGDVKLTDFGIAKALDLMYNEEGKVIAGKDDYLSPEQASYAVTDHRADIFAAGIVLAELLLQRNVFHGSSRNETLKNILELPIPAFTRMRSDIDQKLDSLLGQMLTRDREKRIQSAADLLHSLELYLYSDGYGPTNEKLAVYLRELFDSPTPPIASLPPTRRAPPSPPVFSKR